LKIFETASVKDAVFIIKGSFIGQSPKCRKLIGGYSLRSTTEARLKFCGSLETKKMSDCKRRIIYSQVERVISFIIYNSYSKLFILNFAPSKKRAPPPLRMRVRDWSPNKGSGVHFELWLRDAVPSDSDNHVYPTN
jgi:hypothetical protein